MRRYKESSPVPFVLISGFVCAMFLGGIYCLLIVGNEPKKYMTLDGIETIVGMFVCGGMGGGAIGLSLYFMARPSYEVRTHFRLMEEQNDLISRQTSRNGSSITEEINRLNQLRINGTITEEEFNILKQKIINS